VHQHAVTADNDGAERQAPVVQVDGPGQVIHRHWHGQAEVLAELTGRGDLVGHAPVGGEVALRQVLPRVNLARVDEEHPEARQRLHRQLVDLGQLADARRGAVAAEDQHHVVVAQHLAEVGGRPVKGRQPEFGRAHPHAQGFAGVGAAQRPVDHPVVAADVVVLRRRAEGLIRKGRLCWVNRLCCQQKLPPNCAPQVSKGKTI
jgi:hypothetical protein